MVASLWRCRCRLAGGDAETADAGAAMAVFEAGAVLRGQVSVLLLSDDAYGCEFSLPPLPLPLPLHAHGVFVEMPPIVARTHLRKSYGRFTLLYILSCMYNMSCDTDQPLWNYNPILFCCKCAVYCLQTIAFTTALNIL
ncbi:hypothetical protein ABZP36_032555 [Zizania latifolia]